MKEIGFLITSQGWGGLEINVLKLVSWLNERNWDIRLYSIKESKIFQEAVRSSIETTAIEPHGKYFDLRSAFLFSKILKRDRIDTLMVFDNKDIDFCFLTKIFYSGKLRLLYQQHMQIGVNKKDLLHTLRFSAIDQWISPLEFLRNEVIEKTRLKPEKIKVIPLGTETNDFTHQKYTREEARKRLGIYSSVPLMGIMGRIDPKKGQLFLVKAVHELIRQGIPIKLLVVGSPTINDEQCQKYNQDLKLYVSENNLEKDIFFLGHTDEPDLFYNAIDMFALATDGETYGMVTIEAMLSGVPVIATNSGGTPEILNYGELGSLYDPGDLVGFCQKTKVIIQNPENTRNIAAKAKKSALERFSHDQEIDQIEQLLLT